MIGVKRIVEMKGEEMRIELERRGEISEGAEKRDEKKGLETRDR